jgi:hypothetical protein
LTVELIGEFLNYTFTPMFTPMFTRMAYPQHPPRMNRDSRHLAGRAGILRHRAELLAQEAASENRDESRCRYLLDLAATFRRAAAQAAVNSIQPKLKSRNSSSSNPGQDLNRDLPTCTPPTKHGRHNGNIHMTDNVADNIRPGWRHLPEWQVRKAGLSCKP